MQYNNNNNNVLYKLRNQMRFFQFEIIINVLFVPASFENLFYGFTAIRNLYSFSAGIYFRRQILTSMYVH